MKVKSESEVAQSCPTLCNPMDCSPLGSSIHGVFQARVLDWGAIAFSSILYIVIALCSSPRAYWTPSYTRGSSSSVIIFAFSYWSWDSGGKNTGVVCRCLFKWFTFCQDSPWWPFRLGWPCTVWLIAALIYASPFTRTRLWSMKGTKEQYSMIKGANYRYTKWQGCISKTCWMKEIRQKEYILYVSTYMKL